MDKKKSGDGWGILGVLGILILPLLCCGGPFILAALGATGLGATLAAFTKNWVLGGILLILASIILFILIKRSRKSVKCKPNSLQKSKNTECCSNPTELDNQKE